MIEVYTDGASRGNPGRASSSFLFVENGKVLHFSSQYIGIATNNVAEYTAMINALNFAIFKNIAPDVLVSDSELVVSQVNGIYRVKASHLKKLLDELLVLKERFPMLKFVHSKRENKYIKVADKLCNIMLDL